MSTWLDKRSQSVITLIPGLSEGYYVHLHTDAPVASGYSRQTRHNSILEAAQQVHHLMTSVLPGEWSLVPETGLVDRVPEERGS